jgi:hypothetical protein
MMSLKSKCELLEVVRPRYLKAGKFEKQKILDEFTSATGYHRKHAIRVLRNQEQVQNHLKGKTKTYKTIMVAKWFKRLSKSGRSMDRSVPNGCDRFPWHRPPGRCARSHSRVGTLPGN